MPDFKDVLATLPSIDQLEAIELTDTKGHTDRLPNLPGKAGSLAVYNALLEEFGEVDAKAAEKGLTLFSEHTQDARANPGKHPNIDRLFAVLEGSGTLNGKRIPKRT